jgi:hypothetical protein
VISPSEIRLSLGCKLMLPKNSQPIRSYPMVVMNQNVRTP